MTTLYELSAEYQSAFLALADSDGIDEQTIADTLEGMEGELVVKCQAVTAHCLNIEAEAESIKAVEQRLAARRKSLEKQSAWYRGYLLRNMQACGITEIKANDGSFRVRVMAGRESVIVDDEQAIPADLLRIKTEPDKTAIAAAIKDGREVPGAHIERKPALKID